MSDAGTDSSGGTARAAAVVCDLLVVGYFVAHRIGRLYELRDVYHSNPVPDLALLGLLVGAIGFVSSIALLIQVRFKHSVPVFLLSGALCCLAVYDATPSFAPDRGRANTRACYGNQKTLEGALEMYSVDTKANVTSLSPDVFRALKSGGYLQSIPTDPGEGPATSGHYMLETARASVTCTTHGSHRR